MRKVGQNIYFDSFLNRDSEVEKKFVKLQQNLTFWDSKKNSWNYQKKIVKY